jgi:hypothetical protein
MDSRDPENELAMALPASRTLPAALRIAFAVPLLAGFAFALEGCPGHLENPERFGPLTCNVPASFKQSCASAGCHSASSPANGLDLASDGVAARVVNVMASASGSCAGHVLADPGNPDESLLVTKLGDSPPCGSHMPLTGTSFTDAQIECVRSWIEQQAGGSGGSGGGGAGP